MFNVTHFNMSMSLTSEIVQVTGYKPDKFQTKDSKTLIIGLILGTIIQLPYLVVCSVFKQVCKYNKYDETFTKSRQYINKTSWL